MGGYLEEAKEFYQEALKEFEEGLKEGDKTLIRDACEKAWGAVVQATNELFVRKGIEKLPKSHRERRLLLYQLEKMDDQVKGAEIVDRFMARDHVLHMRGFYNGDIDPEEVKENLTKVKQFIKDIGKMIAREEALISIKSGEVRFEEDH